MSHYQEDFFGENFLSSESPSPKLCRVCGELKPLSNFRVCRLYKNTKIGEYRRSECKSCEQVASKQLNKAKKEASKKPVSCECCSKITENLVIDHDHSTGRFRGWLCRNCNQGIGKLGDTIEDLEMALIYLKRALREIT